MVKISVEDSGALSEDSNACSCPAGYAGNIIAHHGILDEGSHFLLKPFPPKAMTEKVREVLDGSIANSDESSSC